jgi:hypothetical protein
MVQAWAMHKKRDYAAARTYIVRCCAPDWRLACTLWLDRRQRLYESRTPDSKHSEET